jgi:hypothetical protein
MKTAAVDSSVVRRVFLIPCVLAIVSALGLVSALVGDGIWDGLSWLALTAPLATICFCLVPAR